MWCGRRSLTSLGLLVLGLGLLVACAPELERFEQRRSARGTLGEEVYKVLCRRMAGTAYPEDIRGLRSEALCLGDTATVRAALASTTHEPRLAALAARRALVAGAIDDTFAGSLSDPLEHLLRGLVPFYDPPGERVQEATRALATLLERLAGDPAAPSAPADADALAALARLLHEGAAPVDASFGAVRALLGAPSFGEVAGKLLTHTDDAAVRPAFDTLLSGLALGLATTKSDPAKEADLADLKRLLLRTHPDFASGTALHAVLRDGRGAFVPSASGDVAVPYPFVDADADGLADVEAGELQSAPDLPRPLPAPFPAVGEPETARDEAGRALAIAPGGSADPSRLLYRTTDLDATLLSGLMRVGQGLFREPALTRGLASAVGPLLGESASTTERYGAFDLRYAAPVPAKSPLLDLVHGATALLDQPVIDDALALSEKLLFEREEALVDVLSPLLTIEQRTRASHDAYPGARLRPGHTLWSELLFEVEKLSRRRTSAGGETMLEALTRASLGYGRNLQKPGAPIERILDPALLRRQGSVYAALMRFKDEWRANPKGASSRAADEPSVLGGFRTPVDRSRPDTPVRCGRDGCGGLVAGTPFARWAKPGQQCVMQRSGRPLTGRECGEPANQSLFQRSLGLIAEMAGRAQCNKPISIANLLDQAIEDPCVGAIQDGTPECEARRRQQAAERDSNVREAEQAVRTYACPANASLFAPCRRYAARFPSAFIDPDGADGEPAHIAACHLIDLQDVGRAFGKVITGEFTIDIPNPWVRRYLEDIARAGDRNGDGAQDIPTCTAAGRYFNYPILDPLLPPSCIPEAAKLARDLYVEMPRTVGTLGELVAYLLDDPQLFASADDARRLRPDPRSLSRVLFTTTESEGFVLFDPPLVRGAPKVCTESRSLPACVMDDSDRTPPTACCIANPTQPPLRYRLDTYYGATTFAWEQTIRLTDGTALSFFDTMKSVSDTIARFDFDAQRGDDPRNFEDTSYALSTLGKIVAEHYDTAANPAAQDSDPSGMGYRRLTGLASYEELFADALDDGAVELAQSGPDGEPLFAPDFRLEPEQRLGLMSHAIAFLSVLDELDMGGERDGIDVSVELSEQLLSGHARCAGPSRDRRVIGGIGPCDRALRGEPGFVAPLTYRDGRSHVCERSGRCFDGGQLPRRFTSPARQVFDALDATGARIDADPTRTGALRGMVSGVVDALLSIDGRRFADRRAVRLMRVLFDESKQRLDDERRAGTLASVRARTDEDAAKVLHEPVVVGALGVLDGLHGEADALGALSRYLGALLGAGGEAALRPLVAGLFDALQLLPADALTRALMRTLAASFVPEVDALVRTGGPAAALAPQTGMVARNLFMLRETARQDDARVLERVLQNLTRANGTEQAPLVRLFDALLETNRVQPGAEGSARPDDLRALFQRMSAVIRDEQRGFERIYRMVRCSRAPRAADCAD